MGILRRLEGQNPLVTPPLTTMQKLSAIIYILILLAITFLMVLVKVRATVYSASLQIQLCTIGYWVNIILKCWAGQNKFVETEVV